MTDKTPADAVIEVAAKIIEVAAKINNIGARPAARALYAAGLLHTAQDDLDLGDAERIKAERDDLRATVERCEALADEFRCQLWPAYRRLRAALDGGEQ